MQNTSEKKQELLAHYDGREPRKFYQIDGWLPDECDGIVEAGPGGFGMTGSETTELMHGTEVRVLIPADGRATSEQIAALLRMAAGWISRSFYDLNKRASRQAAEARVFEEAGISRDQFDRVKRELEALANPGDSDDELPF